MYVGDWEFSNCPNLASMNISKGVGRICNSTFPGCSGLISIEIPVTVESIDEDSFNGCSNINEIHIPKGVRTIGTGAFSRCSNLKSIHISESVESIGRGEFNSCTELSIMAIDPNNGFFSFSDRTLYDRDQRILYKCFDYEAENYTMPQGISCIGEYAFSNCKSLRSVVIPNNV